MASISTNKRTGVRRILFLNPDGTRGCVYLGKVSETQANGVLPYVEDLVNSVIGNTPARQTTAAWLADVGVQMRRRLAKAGLIELPPEEQAELEASRSKPTTLGTFLDEYLATLHVKPNTSKNHQLVRGCLLDYFGTDKPLGSITPRDADQFRAWLVTVKGYAQATVSKWVIITRQFFKAARRWRLIAENPFTDVVAGGQTNKSRECFITRETIDQLVAACPDDEWRLLVLLARYGGLRVPSEVLALTWDCIDWEQGRILVRVPKLEHLDGKATRHVPLFPELRQPLLKAFERADDGSEHVITRYRDTRQNLRTQLLRIVRNKAKLKPWGRPWHNLRSSRETELVESYPLHTVCAWLGNSPAVAGKHYLQVRDEHFRQAAGFTGFSPDRKTAHICAQQSDATKEMRCNEAKPGLRELRDLLRKIDFSREIGVSQKVYQRSRQEANNSRFTGVFKRFAGDSAHNSAVDRAEAARLELLAALDQLDGSVDEPVTTPRPCRR